MDTQTANRIIAQFLASRAALSAKRQANLEATLGDVTEQIDVSRRESVIHARQSVKSILRSLDEAVAKRQLQHAASSPELNCWEILGLQYSEIQHSLVLGWLLDRRASHAQGGLFLQEFLRAVSQLVPIPLACANERYRVATEVRHLRSRIDVEVLGESFLLHIESKVNAAEGEDQTCREREDLKAKARSKDIQLDRAWGLYLTVNGSACSDTEKFRPVSWSAVISSIRSASQIVTARHPRNRHLPWVLDSYTQIVNRHVLRNRSGVPEVEEMNEPRSV